MGTIGLFLSGAVLFLNGLMLLGKADGKSVAYFNLFVGAIQTVSPFYLAVVSDQSNWELYNNASIFLFGLTYLYVGVTTIKDLNGSGLGYYSLWVSIAAIVYAAVSIIHFGDLSSALTWIMWAYLWFLFYLSMSRGKNIDEYIGKVAIVLSWVTLTIPSLLNLTGVAAETAALVNYVISLGAIVYFCYLTFSWQRRKQYAS
ncbi:AmiS/UreI family transporter [Actinomycetes bacterium NPDC127524]